MPIRFHPLLAALCRIVFACVLFTRTVGAQFLFDATKAEMAGNADWVIDADLHNLSVSSASDGSGKTGTGGTESNPQRIPTPAASGITSSTAETYWDGGLSAWGVSLVKHGQSVETLPYNGQITYGNSSNAQDLSHYKVFVIDEPNILFTGPEKTAILTFVKNGGGLFMISDHGVSDRNNDGKDSVAVWNDLMTNNTVQDNPFGISFNGDKVTPASPVADASTGDPVVHGSLGAVTSFAYSDGSTMTLNTAQNSSVTAAMFSSSAKSSASVMVAYGTFGLGRFVAAGDSSPFEDGTGDNAGDTLYDGWDEGGGGTSDGLYNDGRLTLNASIWLAAPEPGCGLLLGAGAMVLGMARRRPSRGAGRSARFQ